MSKYDEISYIAYLKEEEGKSWREIDKILHHGEGYSKLKFMRYKKEQKDFLEKRGEELKKKIQDCKLQAEEKKQFLNQFLKEGSCQKLDIYLAEALIGKILLFPDGIIEIYYKFTNGE